MQDRRLLMIEGYLGAGNSRIAFVMSPGLASPLMVAAAVRLSEHEILLARDAPTPK